MYRKILVLWIMAAMLSGCVFAASGSPEATGFLAPYYIAEANVPFADNVYPNRWDKVQKLEEDAYGREYFLYETYSRFLNEYIVIHIICQKSTEEGAYFYYPELCYAMFRAAEASAETDAAEQLKAQNDWGQPLHEDKMACMNKQTYYDLNAGEGVLEAALLEHLELGSSYSALVNPMEILSENTQVFFAEVMLWEDETSAVPAQSTFYYGIYDEDADDPILFCREASGQLDCQSEIMALKQEWQAQSAAASGETLHIDPTYTYLEGIFEVAPWESAEFPFDSPCITNSQTAVRVATALLTGYQEQGYFEGYALPDVFYETQSDVWVVTFCESPDYPGASFSIALNGKDAAVIQMWLGE